MSNSTGNDDLFKINIFHVDSYCTKPIATHDAICSEYRKSKTKSVTIMRVFGSTDEGLKVCLHLHQYYPHITVRHRDIVSAYACLVDCNNRDILDLFIHDLEQEIKNKNQFSKDDEHFIYLIEPYTGFSIYGYHETQELFYRIYFYSNWILGTAKNILETGCINGHQLIVYDYFEFILQFYIENEICLNQLTLKNVTFRKTHAFDNEHNEKIKSLKINLLFNDLCPTSTCFLECDATVKNIVQTPHEKTFPTNSSFTPSHPGVINLWNDQFSRYTEDAYSNFIKILQGNVERMSNLPSKFYFQTKIFKNFMENLQIPELSPKKSQPVDSLDDLEDIDDIDGFDMNFTQKELDLDKDVYNDIYSFEENISNEDQVRIRIPQLDGIDDEKESQFSEASQKEEINSLNEKKRKIVLNDVTVELPKISLPQVLKLNRVFLSDEVKTKIHKKCKIFSESECSSESDKIDSLITGSSDNIENEIYSYYSDVCHDISCVSSTLGGVNEQPMSTTKDNVTLSPFIPRNSKNSVLHSTPSRNNQSVFKINSHRTASSKQNLFNEIAHKDTNGCLTFIATQNSQESNYSHLNYLNSFISIPSKYESFEKLTINTLGNVEWKRSLEMTLMPLELHIETRDTLSPNAKLDSIKVAMFAIYSEDLKDKSRETFSNQNDKHKMDFLYLGAIVVKPNSVLTKELAYLDQKALHIDYVSSEMDLYLMLISYVKAFDPDVMLGFEVDTLSWGYLLQRSIALDIDVMPSISRVENPYQSKTNSAGSRNNPPQLVGRIILNSWDILRYELTLRSYTFENIYQHLFQEHVARYSSQFLNELWSKSFAQNDLPRNVVLRYYLNRVVGLVKILVHLNLIRRTFDLSCLFGMKFEDALNRGSQFRVESMFFPICKLENYLPVRFPKKFIAGQSSPECISLVLEPTGSLHFEPVVVLDFQSLYPSVMIAHNYCFSTCLGKIKNIVRSDKTFGCYQLETEKQLFAKLKDDIHFSPNGVAFVKSNIKRGLLPKLLEDLLYTRILIKAELKEISRQITEDEHHSKSSERKLKNLKRQLDVCQLGLKLISNVTYGYTSANYSGRMPCVDLADSIVSKGRETLEQTINYINQWGIQSGTGAKVIYGDTDSVFISFPETSLSKAFEWAGFLSKEITKRNPHPMCIKLEKIYQPCVLLAKKRYCGYAFESANQATPTFDCKGIETVRRDSCIAASKILEKSIKILFESKKDLQQLKPFIQWQIKKILNARLSNLNDFVFAKEYKGFMNYCNESVIPSCIVARKRMSEDAANEPKMLERVPYVIVCGSDNDRLADLVREPFDLLNDKSLRLNTPYYLKRVIFPPLARVLQSISNGGMSLLQSWYDEVRHYHTKRLTNINQVKTGLDKLLLSSCIICLGRVDEKLNKTNTEYVLCDKCRRSSQKSAIIVKDHLWTAGHKLNTLIRTCIDCCAMNPVTLSSLTRCSHVHNHPCTSQDCRNLFPYHQTSKDYIHLSSIDQAVTKQFESK